jgi:hypothetical protein
MKTRYIAATLTRFRIAFGLVMMVLLLNDTLRAQGYCKLVLPGEGEGPTVVRPTLSGPEEIIGTNHFRIHYTFSGIDQTTYQWANQVSYLAEYAWQSHISLGWPSPPSDGGIGGDANYDIYIWNTEYHYEQETPLGVTQGENRHPSSYPDAFTSWIEISNNPLGSISSRTLQEIVVHEFNHACQFAYTGSEPR